MILMNVERAPRVCANAAKDPIDMSFQFDTGKSSEMSRYATRNSTKQSVPRAPLSRISVSLPESLLMALDRLVARRGYPNRSHAITLVLSQLYDVHRELAGVRQRCSAEIISCMNSQVASGQTLEVMLIHGAGHKLKVIQDEVARLRGVVFAKLQLVGPSSSQLNSDLLPPVGSLTHVGLGRALSLS
jgi:CopG family nickel-responsive transcriptional regulator